ncbi:hypothetical protein QBC34DRAFT_429394 [Podospora aff. communis PSN243]|uniref:Uncharacterized protein n=1 Tax=Podospora aff. communis PSN243 TaxID=3040156 RepID=A0AAV9G9Q0_9PEZI|nr:hypothetical protein QBC34DRAFT_429394 [Podospora aff. communis PSN243]
MSRPPPSPPLPVKQKDFSFSHAGLLHGTKLIPRCPVHLLQQTFSPACTTDQYINTTSKPWLVAQCVFYDLPFKRPLDADDLRFVLICALQDGRISEEVGVPEKMREVEEKMRGEWEARVGAYEEEMRVWKGERLAMEGVDATEEARCYPEVFVARWFLDGEGRPDREKTKEGLVLGGMGEKEKEGLWEAVRKVEGLSLYVTDRRSVVCWGEGDGLVRVMDRAFAEIAGMEEARRDGLFVPTMEAHFDVNRLMAKYFLSGVFGQPVRERTPRPVVLRGWFGGIQERQRLLGAVRQCEGLSVCYFTDEHKQDFAILGWYSEVLEEQKRLENAMRQRLAEREMAKRDAESRPWVAALQPHFWYCQNRVFKPKYKDAFMMIELVGSWMVKCPAIEKQFGVPPGAMTLDIWNDKPRNKHGLVAAVDFGLTKGTMLIAQSDESMRELEEMVEGYTPERERRMNVGADYRKKYINIARDASNPMKPLDLLSTPVREPGQVLLHWMGRQIGEESVEIDPDNKNMGYISLDMQSRVVGQGKIRYVSFFAGPLDIWIYKLSDEPRRMPDRWSNFCSSAPDITKLDVFTNTVPGSVALSQGPENPRRGRPPGRGFAPKPKQ